MARAELAIDAYLLRWPFSEKDARVGDHVRMINRNGDILDELFLGIGFEARR
jgi:hypothetical protein